MEELEYKLDNQEELQRDQEEVVKQRLANLRYIEKPVYSSREEEQLIQRLHSLGY